MFTVRAPECVGRRVPAARRHDDERVAAVARVLNDVELQSAKLTQAKLLAQCTKHTRRCVALARLWLAQRAKLERRHRAAHRRLPPRLRPPRPTPPRMLVRSTTCVDCPIADCLPTALDAPPARALPRRIGAARRRAWRLQRRAQRGATPASRRCLLLSNRRSLLSVYVCAGVCALSRFDAKKTSFPALFLFLHFAIVLPFLFLFCFILFYFISIFVFVFVLGLVS